MSHRITTTDHVTWIDVHDTDARDLAYLRDTVTIHPLALEEFTTPTVRARATQYDNGIFLSLHIPLYDREERATYGAELDIILTEHHLITGHTKPIYQLDAFFDRFRKDATLHTNHIGNGPAYLLHAILDILLTSCFKRLEHIGANIDAIERGVFHGDARRMVEEISFVKRDILNFRRAVMPQRSVIESLLRKDPRFIPTDLHPYIHDLSGTNTRIWNMLESYKETIESLEDTNDTLLSHRLNEKMNALTLISAIVLPSTLYASILGINAFVPLQNHPHGFFIHLAIMIGLIIATWIFFRIRRWV